jgi:hypothetical protein
MLDYETLLVNDFAYERAIDEARAWFRESQQPEAALAAIVARVQAKCPGADMDEVRQLIADRMSRRWRS